MDDFEVVSGMNVLLKHKVSYMPLAKYLVVMESNPTIIQKNIHQPRGLKMMSILQLRKNHSHDEFMLAAIDVIEKGSSSEPTSIETLLPLHEHHDANMVRKWIYPLQERQKQGQILKKGERNKPLKQHMFTKKYHLDG